MSLHLPKALLPSTIGVLGSGSKSSAFLLILQQQRPALERSILLSERNMLLETANACNNVQLSVNAKYPCSKKNELLISLQPNCGKLILGHVVSAEPLGSGCEAAAAAHSPEPLIPTSFRTKHIFFRASPAGISDKLTYHGLLEEV